MQPILAFNLNIHDSLKLKTLLPQPAECWNYRHVTCVQASLNLSCVYNSVTLNMSFPMFECVHCHPDMMTIITGKQSNCGYPPETLRRLGPSTLPLGGMGRHTMPTKCGGLSKNDSHRPIYLSTQSSAGRLFGKDQMRSCSRCVSGNGL